MKDGNAIEVHDLTKSFKVGKYSLFDWLKHKKSNFLCLNI